MTKDGTARIQLLASCLFLALSGRLWGAPPIPAEPPAEAKELIVLLATGADVPTPTEVVDSVGRGHSPWQGLSGRLPMRARFGLSFRAAANGQEELVAHPDSPRARLERYVIFSFPSDVDLEQAKRDLSSDPHVLHVEENVQLSLLSTVPTDPFAARASTPQQYQWGIYTLKLDQAWDRVKGHAYLGSTDTGLEVNHPDLRAFHVVNGSTIFDGGNFRSQFSKDLGYSTPTVADYNVDEMQTQGTVTPTNVGHGTHTSGILAATANNGIGVAGACWHCSLMMAKVSKISSGYNSYIQLSAMASGTTWLVDQGAQVLNASLGFPNLSCSGLSGDLGMYCTALAYAEQRDVAMFASSGNEESDLKFPASDSRVIAVGGISPDGSFWQEAVCPQPGYIGTEQCGSNYTKTPGSAMQVLVAPAKDVLSTFYEGKIYISGICGDSSGYGLCTGTSMSSPFVAGIAGLLRSANPLLTKAQVRTLLTAHASRANAWDPKFGYGVPDASASVTAAMGTVADQVLPNRLTPLFSLYSNTAQDYLYTTVPQMAAAALFDSKAPYFAAGPTVPGYSAYPGVGGCTFSPCLTYPSASVYVFTTDVSPYTGAPALAPLYRMSFRGTYNGNVNDRDTTYATTQADVRTLKGFGYDLDGIEGYVYSRCSPEPGCIPPGAVRLYRRYNRTRDDFAIFPESELAPMQAAGYTEYLASAEWIGYVYPNVDSDGDGVIDGFERLIGTNPSATDSDCDGASDGQELLTFGANGYGDPNQGPCGKVVFADVPQTYWERAAIEAIYAAQITSGCASNPLSYCPESDLTRAQVAIFLLRAKEGGSYVPPAPNCSAPMFSDVPCTSFAAAWIEELARRGITQGCASGLYCPNDLVTQAQIAIFLLRTSDGGSYQPPPASCSSPTFSDVPCTDWAAPWIEELARRGITTGCGGGKYCPNSSVTRAQAADLLVKTFNIPPRP